MPWCGQNAPSQAVVRILLSILTGAFAYDGERRIQSARLYGDVRSGRDDYSYYFVDLLVGTPKPQRASVIVDTASQVCGFPCSGCKSCGKHIDAIFDVSKSKSFKWIGCDSKSQCHGGCNDGRCAYEQSYAEGSSISGHWFEDYFSLGDEFQRNPPVRGRMGCHKRETKLFYSQKANGIFGMAPGKLGKPSILAQLFADKSHVDTSRFAICLSNEGGALTVGGHNTSRHSSFVTWVPMPQPKLSSLMFYEVTLSELGLVGEESVAIGDFGRTFVDSGSTYTYLPHGAYVNLRQAIERYCQSHGRCGATKIIGARCFRLSKGYNGLDLFPTIQWTFKSGGKYKWKPSSYLFSNDGGKEFCWGFDDNGRRRETVLGATWMLHSDIIFDLSQQRLGFAEARCPEHRKRPPPPSGTVKVAQDKNAFSKFAAKVSDSGSSTGMGLLLAASITCALAAVWRNLRIAALRAAEKKASEAALSAKAPAKIPSTSTVGHEAAQAIDERSRHGMALVMWWNMPAQDSDESTDSDEKSSELAQQSEPHI